MRNVRARRVRSVSCALVLGFVVLTTALCPSEGLAQLEVSAGVLFIPEPSLGGPQVGALLSAAASSDALGLPLFLQVGVARTDFASLGQDYHETHYLFALGTEWFVTQGTSRLGLRLGLGAYGEYQTVETNPPLAGGDNWIETVVPGLVLERDLGGGRRLVVRLEDAVLGPWFAVLDPSEYGIEHRILFVVGARF